MRGGGEEGDEGEEEEEVEEEGRRSKKVRKCIHNTVTAHKMKYFIHHTLCP